MQTDVSASVHGDDDMKHCCLIKFRIVDTQNIVMVMMRISAQRIFQNLQGNTVLEAIYALYRKSLTISTKMFVTNHTGVMWCT